MPRITWLPAVILVLAAGGHSAAASNADERCVRLDNRIADLRLKMRLGYSAREGRLHRQKLATLEVERRKTCR